MTEAVLSVRGLATEFRTREGALRAVDGVSFDLMPGQIMGLVGESGSGKSVTGYSIMGLIDEPGRIVEGSILYRGRELVGLAESQWRHLRGDRIAMIFQDPMMTLNPVLRIDTQLIETLRAHRKVTREAARARACRALEQVGIPAPEERLRAYPHQLSGGMRQRIAIAIALLHEPEVIIADEPTTALDVTIQAQILAEVQKLAREQGTALIWITHDLTVVAGLADTVAVMYGGQLVEQGGVGEVLDRPLHPYTAGLIASLPSSNDGARRLAQIPGMTPKLGEFPSGCAFRTRCTRSTTACHQAPAASAPVPGRVFRCFHPMGDGR